MTRQSKCQHCGKWVNQQDNGCFDKFCDKCSKEYYLTMGRLDDVKVSFMRAFTVFLQETREVDKA